MNNIDKWCAEQCGVEIRHSQSWCLNDNPVGAGLPLYRHYGWTIADPRCREIVRERFKLSTCTGAYGLFYCYTDKTEYATDGIGKETIAEAEIACITAIYEARDD